MLKIERDLNKEVKEIIHDQHRIYTSGLKRKTKNDETEF
jgi:hypothetical protein